MSNHHKGLVLIVDGMGDRPNPILADKTPLEHAKTPNLDAFAKAGMTGGVLPLGIPMPVGTPVGTGMLLGLPPSDARRLVRGPVEAVGAGIKLKKGDVALRCNFATISDSGGQILDRRAGRITDGTSDLAKVLDGIKLSDGITTRFSPATGHRAVLILRGSSLSGQVSDTDPGAGREDAGILTSMPFKEGDKKAGRCAKAINTFVKIARKELRDHPVNKKRRKAGLSPANAILTRGAGKAQQLSSIAKRFGISPALITGEATIRGLGELFGFRIIEDKRFTGHADTDLGAKMAAAESALEKSDLVFVHVKAPDLFSHDFDPAGKSAFLAALDGHLSSLRKRDDLVVGVTGDHSTSSLSGAHSGDAVPSLIAGPGCRIDRVKSFGETACQSGGFGTLSSTSFLLAILDAMNRLPIYSARDESLLF